MNEMGLKEKAMAAVIVVIALYAVAVMTWFLYSGTAWRSAFKKYEREEKTFNKEERLISERNKWTEAYEAEKAAMPTFASGQATDTTWLRKIEAIAKTNLVLITQIDAGAEVQVDNVLELPIEVRNLEGSLEALVRFMHALENSEDGMFDIRSMNLQPNRSKSGYMKGSLTLTCAYMRDE